MSDDVKETKSDDVCFGYIDGEMAQFEEVAGTCSNRDNVSEACCTVRSVVLGLFFVLWISVFHQWANFQSYPPFISSILVIVLSYPCGCLWAKIIPRSGRFTLKENGFILVMGNVAYMYHSVFIYATLTTLKVLERDQLSFLYYFFFILSIQFLGFGLAGILRRFLVWPSEVIWPQNLPLIAVLRTLHERQKINEQQWKNLFLDRRLLFFVGVSFVSFLYHWFPLYFSPILQSFSWMCWIDTTNNPLSQLTSVRGLAMAGGGLTLDWKMITEYLGSPFVLPAWALLNITFGFVFILWFLVPIVYGTNVRNVLRLPIGGVVSTDFTALSLVTSFTSFASLTCVFVHTLLFHGQDIWKQFTTKSLNSIGNDMHSRLISLYPTVPDWCYLQLFASALIVACVTCDHAQWLNWSLVLLALLIGSLLTLPFGLVSSITGQLLHNLSVYYLCLLIGQALSLQNSPKNISTFIALGYVVFVQTLALVQDMKLAHYIKIGPRPLFAAQCLAGFVCSTFSIGIRYLLLRRGSTGNNWSIFNNTKLGWTLLNDYVGFFDGDNKDNRHLLWAFLIGAFLPLPTWILSRRFESLRWMKKLHWPLIFVTLGWIPAIVPSGALFTWIVLGLTIYFLFGQYHYRQRQIYLLSAGLDLGLNLTILAVYLIFRYPPIAFPQWWGNRNDTQQDNCPRALQTW